MSKREAKRGGPSCGCAGGGGGGWRELLNACAEDALWSVLVSDAHAWGLWRLRPRASGCTCPQALDMRWVLLRISDCGLWLRSLHGIKNQYLYLESIELYWNVDINSLVPHFLISDEIHNQVMRRLL